MVLGSFEFVTGQRDIIFPLSAALSIQKFYDALILVKATTGSS